MPRLGPVTRAELVDKLRKLGFEGPHQGRKHAYMTRDGLAPVRIPNTDIDDIDLLKRVLRQADVSRDEFMNI